MAICNHCGSELREGAPFCSVCGAKILRLKKAGETGACAARTGSVPEPINVFKENMVNVQSPVKKTRKGMEIAAIVSYVMTAIMFFGLTLEEGDICPPLAFLILGIMFTCLAFSPKECPNLFGKNKGFRKTFFVAICIALSFAMVMISPDYDDDNTGNTASVIITNEEIE